MNTSDFQNKQTYNFDVYPSAIIGNNFKSVTVLGKFARVMANKEIDTAALWVQCYPTLPAATPNDPDAQDYLMIQFPNGETTVISLAWIKPETIALVDARTITAKISNVTANDLIKIKAALIQNGYPSVDLSIS